MTDNKPTGDQLRGIDLEVLEGNPRLLAWLTSGSRTTGLYEIWPDEVAPPQCFWAGGDIEGPGDLIPIYDILALTERTRAQRGDDNRRDFGTLGRAVKRLLRPGERILLATAEKRIVVEAILAFDARTWQPPSTPSEALTFVVAQTNGRLSPSWEAMEYLYGQVAWAKGYTHRKTFEINISLDRALEMDAAARSSLVGVGDWLDSQKPSLRKLLTGALKNLPDLDAAVSRLVAQYGAERVQESLDAQE